MPGHPSESDTQQGFSTPDAFLEDFEAWDVEASYLPRWLEVLPELKIRVDEAIDRYERIRAMASTDG